ncbi:MAG: hypothetical protein R2795_24730 [Saprospiraceae bacterium]
MKYASELPFDCVAPLHPAIFLLLPIFLLHPLACTAPLQVDFDASASVANATGGLPLP